MALTLSPYNQELLAKLTKDLDIKHPKAIEAFLWCTQIPRESGNIEGIAQKLLELGKACGWEVARDNGGNVRFRKPATHGAESATPIILQAHMDMVASKTRDSTHDFAKDPIKVIVDGKWMKADRTTLGADNGIGIGACIALMMDESFPHPQVECLFTKDEETDMSGAKNLEPYPFLTGKCLINIDSEEVDKICIGCSGGHEKLYELPVQRAPINGDFAYMEIELFKLLGGHTGLDINKDRANALKLIARALNNAWNQKIEVYLDKFVGGNAKNAIPRNVTVGLFVKKSQEAELVKLLNEHVAMYKREFRVTESRAGEEEPGMELTIAQPRYLPSVDPLTKKSSKRLLEFLLALPHGVLRLSPEVKGLVETSVSTSVIELKSDVCKIHLLGRSSSDEQMKLTAAVMDSIGSLAGAKFEEGMFVNYYPGWQPDVRSPLLKMTADVFRELKPGKEAEIYAIHAGLECGIIQGNYPGMDCISVGPDLFAVHSPDEKLDLSTCDFVYEWVAGVLEKTARSLAA